MKNNEANKVIDNAEQTTQEPEVDVKVTIDGNPEEPKKFWTKRRKIIAGVVVGAIAIAFGLRKLTDGMEIEEIPDTVHRLTDDIVKETASETVKEVVANATT